METTMNKMGIDVEMVKNVVLRNILPALIWCLAVITVCDMLPYGLPDIVDYVILSGCFIGYEKFKNNMIK